MLGAGMLFYAVVTLFGSFLIYRDVARYGCDPSGGVPDSTTCSDSGADVFGALLGIGFCARAISQVGNCLETFAAARVAAYPALRAIYYRLPGSPEQIVYDTVTSSLHGSISTLNENTNDDKEGNNKSLVDEQPSNNKSNNHLENDKDDNESSEQGPRIRAILPAFRIDPSSSSGLKPESIRGDIKFRNVCFAYPTRPHQFVLKEFNLEIPAGKTVAIVGPR
jgi:ABC-type multidrug transport system fused ATPase/permease subunit